MVRTRERGGDVFDADSSLVASRPDLGIGGHDVMWFLARDLAFGADGDAYPDVEPPENIGRPDAELVRRDLDDSVGTHPDAARVRAEIAEAAD